MRDPTIRTVIATRYVEPLREGGSLPAIAEADDDGIYVVKFRGAGQGPKSLIAELLAGEIGRAIGLPVPEIVFVELDAALGRAEPDYEIRSLLNASVGLNLGLDYLPGSLAFDPVAARGVDPLLASQIVWFDAYITNPDRTARNTNILIWHRKLWLIDHGAALYFHHSPGDMGDLLKRARTPFAPIRDHVLLSYASELAEADALLRARLDPETLAAIVKQMPGAWFEEDAEAQREMYLTYLSARLKASSIFVEEAQRARVERV